MGSPFLINQTALRIIFPVIARSAATKQSPRAVPLFFEIASLRSQWHQFELIRQISKKTIGNRSVMQHFRCHFA
jgi:hypothetical protein